MDHATRKRWNTLCEQAAVENDPAKLIEIYKEIIEMLDEKASRLFSAWEQEHQLGPRPTIEQTEKRRIM